MRKLFSKEKKGFRIKKNGEYLSLFNAPPTKLKTSKRCPLVHSAAE
jgi:hypothetical protein